jgi:hypothetical protein
MQLELHLGILIRTGHGQQFKTPQHEQFTRAEKKFSLAENFDRGMAWCGLPEQCPPAW